MIELKVPYTEKDLVKKLGAKWNATLKTWFITSNMDLSAFVQWIPKEANKTSNDTITNTDSNIGSLKQPYSLRSIVDEVKNLLAECYNQQFWIILEISELKVYNNNLFLSLVEYNQQGTLIARVRGIIWNYNQVIKQFIEATNIELKPNIKILAKANLDYNQTHGLSLIINDLDSSYTLGEANAKLLKIKEQLIEQKIFDKNKILPMPFDFHKIAVISPINAAGLGDFQEDANKLEKNNICKFEYYTAIFQGIEARNSINNCLDKIIEAKIDYDVIVIIRGGGASSDLTWLNDYHIAKTICLTKIPILCGIGHNKDQTIIDQIVCRSFDTPSKVINFIINQIVSKAEEAHYNFQLIQQYCDKIHEKFHNDLLHCFEYIKGHSIQKIEYINKLLDLELANIKALVKQQLHFLDHVLETTMEQIIYRSPEKILSMGFCLIYNNLNNLNQNLITSYQMATQAKKISLQFYDGTVKAEIIGD